MESGTANFFEIKHLIAEYEQKKKTDPDKYFQFINYVREHGDSLCKRCWGAFVKDLMLVNYYNDTGSWRNYYYLYPDKDSDWQTKNNFIGNNSLLPDKNYSVFYNFRNQFLALTFYDIMMFDFDFKDFKDQEPAVVKATIDEYLMRLVAAAKTFNINLAFMPFDTDRGYHIFLISNNVDFRHLYWMDLMAAMCNDPWYVAFSFTNGFAIRLNQKKDSPDDFIAEPLSRDIKLSETKVYSKYLKRDLQLRAFKLSDSKSYRLIGDRKDVDPAIFYKVLFQYFLIQYFRSFGNSMMSKVECNIYDNMLGINDGRDRVNAIRDDIKTLYTRSLLYKGL